MFAVGGYESVVGPVEIVEHSLMQWQSGTQDGGKHRLLTEYLANRSTKGRSYLAIFARQYLTDLVCNDLTDALEVPSEPHAIPLDLRIPKFSDPVAQQ